MQVAGAALENAGFTIQRTEDLGARADKIPWYAPLEKAISDSTAPWSRSEEELFPMFGGLSRTTATVISQAAKWRVSRALVSVPAVVFTRVQLFTPLAVFVAQKTA